MMKTLRLFPLVILLLVGFAQSYSQTRERGQVETKYTWNLEEIYASNEAWEADKIRLLADLPKFESYKGKLGTSSKTLQAFFDSFYDF